MRRAWDEVMEAFSTPLPHEGPICVALIVIVLIWRFTS